MWVSRWVVVVSTSIAMREETSMGLRKLRFFGCGRYDCIVEYVYTRLDFGARSDRVVGLILQRGPPQFAASTFAP